MVLAWITNPLRKSPGLLPNTHKIRHNYPDFSLWCAELIEILTREIPLVIDIYFKLKYKMFIISDEMQEMINIDFLRTLGCVSINLKGTVFIIILYLFHVAPHFDIGQGTLINDNHSCQASHMIYISTLTLPDEER